MVLLIPLIAAALGALFCRKSKWAAAMLSILSATLCLGLAMKFLIAGEDIAGGVIKLFSLGDFHLSLGFLLDSISANMLFVACFVGWLIHLFSVGYMKHDECKGRFFTGLSFFMFSMTGIVLADNLFMMFVFWEFVGFSSYMLIAHYADTDYAKMASKKAFIANRVGDFGFLIGIIMCYHTLGTVNFSEIAKILQANPALATNAMALLLMCGFLGKSAQFPLQVWLTDAMAGPTPVSALIHAATMVAAGVFMMVRLGVVGIMTPFASDIMLLLCSAMAFCAGFWALGQRDIKKTLAYSTLAHLGIMGAAVGMGAYGIAMMHLTMHAFFKAALFLCAGSVIYACHHEQDMFKMGGLLKKMPVTALVALVAALSIMSVPFFAGYYSKETIVGISIVQMVPGEDGAFSYLRLSVAFMLCIAAILTPLYMGRLWFAVFGGKPLSESAAHAKESSLWMTLPLLILGVFSVAGAYGFVFDKFAWAGGKMAGLLPEYAQRFMSGDMGWKHFHHVLASEPALVFGMSIVDITGVVLLFFTGVMIALAYYLYGRGEESVEESSPILYEALEKHGWFDDVYNYYVAKVQQRFATLLSALDLFVIQGIFVRGSALIAGLTGSAFKDWHRTWVSGYVLWMLAGIVAAIVIFIY